MLKIQLLSTAGGKVIISTKGVKSIQVKVCVLFTRLLLTSKHRFVGVENTIVVKGVKSKVFGFALTDLFVVVNIKHEIVESSSVGNAIIRWKRCCTHQKCLGLPAIHSQYTYLFIHTFINL